MSPKPPLTSTTPQWQLYLYAAIFLVLSIVLSNVIAWFKQFRQEARIAQKTTTLTQDAAVATSPTKAVIPVTILTGFLGSGKTTLLNSILSSPDHGFKIMVLENELGAVSIDHDLIANHPREGVVVMQNGCMCCSAPATATTNELERILDQLLEMQTAATDRFDYLIVETTGVADPGPILKTFLELRASRFRLDGVVALVDTSSLLKMDSQQHWPVEMHSQLVYADLIALNKMDLVDGKGIEVGKLKAHIRTINPDATVVECRHSRLPIADLLHIRTFDASRFDFDAVVESKHTKDLDTVVLSATTPLDLGAFGHWLNNVVDSHWKRGIFRMKGFVLDEGGNVWLLQCVLDTYTLAPATDQQHKTKQRALTSQVVVIGLHLDKHALETSFASVVARHQSSQKDKRV
ncbi:hypothetical protein H257_04915 [Aphanomyces astaci]|uniref:CobW C-terminal domain-containing protein n=1 Tax=Aphanomyces astaci TaxID=112090 RepID=W4GR59_APHAT|nr:hypothetical protein H257_04915 [Aphanomyces astaci]ETV82205.1 hypothetical protein H257_04915 [Aphanomyces astaci]RQM10598.1 hypothetical protein B5M09_011470 [Aphanomyces astaci]|eukprot:XP_009827874.1 hypothetical protein H257_04915 [Aphanomyces astaci]